MTSATPRKKSGPISSSWNGILYEKETNLVSLRTDNYKLKYRRNRLKQKLRELRSKALELAKQMANESSFQQNTRLRQVMNRYEKQIENLSKLHKKLSAAIPVSNEVIDVNDDGACSIDDEYLFLNLNEENKESLKNNYSTSSPEPPKLSPRSPLNYENILPGEIRNSPPILPRVCPPVSLNQNLADEDFHVSKRKTWPIFDDSLTKSTVSANATVSVLQRNSMDEASADLEECVQMVNARQQNNMNVDIENFNVTNRPLKDEKVISLFDDNRIDPKKQIEDDKLADKVPPSRSMVKESEIIKCPGFLDSVPVTSLVTNGSTVAASIPISKMCASTADEKLSSSKERASRSNFFATNRNDVSFTEVNKSSQNTQKVRSKIKISNRVT